MLYCFQTNQRRHLLTHGPGSGMRAVAHPSQAKFLEKLDMDTSVEVCSVSMLNMELNNPDEILENMTKVTAESAVGGFRTLTEPELIALQMGTYSGNKTPDQLYLLLLERHPFMQRGGGFAFSGGASSWLFTFLNYIYDIRRFYDKRLRQQNLQREFGLLTADNLTRFFRVQNADKQSLRPMLTFQAWAISPLSELSAEEVEELPEAFLQRERVGFFQQASKTHDVERAKQLAFWHTTTRFLKFVELLWIEGLGGAKFEPDRFFLRRDEADSFKAFITQLDLRVDNSTRGN